MTQIAPTARLRQNYRDTADLFASAVEQLTSIADMYYAELQRSPQSGLVRHLLVPLKHLSREPGVMYAGDIVFHKSLTALKSAFAGAGVVPAQLQPGPGWSVPPCDASVMFRQAIGAREARAFTFENADQVAVLSASPLPLDFQMALLRLPFPSLFMDFATDAPIGLPFPIPTGGGSFTVSPRAVLLTEQRSSPDHRTMDATGRVIQAGPFVTTTASIFARRDGIPTGYRVMSGHPMAHLGNVLWSWEPSFTYEQGLAAAAVSAEWRSFWNLISKIVLFIHSPTIVQERAQTTPHLRAVMETLRRETDPAPYVLRIRLPRIMRRGHGVSGEPARRLAYRFDVRGHFKHFKRGRLAGRVIWCPAFVKGPDDKPYRPRFNVLLDNTSRDV